MLGSRFFFRKKYQNTGEGDYKGATDHVQDFLCIIGKLINFKTLILPKEHIYAGEMVR
jgi:hypothetical protein